jgi:homoserine dehydrogenase (EC 1.1.1.3)
MRLCVLGAGAVGRAVLELAAEYGHTVTAIADSTSAAVDPDGLDPEVVYERKQQTDTVGDTVIDDALTSPCDALVEATPTTLGDAQPGFGHVRAALERDRDVVLANKGPVAERYGDLRALEHESAGRVRFEATVGGAIPVLSTITDRGSATVEAVRGVLNGTANFILSRMAAEGIGYDHVLAEAQDLGVAETDPTFDVAGTDAALKCVILANVLTGDDQTVSLADATVAGITDLPVNALELAAEDNQTIRLIGEVDADGRVRVGPRLVPESGTLAVSGTRNIVQLETEAAGAISISGRGAGGPATATAVFADLERLATSD